jgi:hypothetical protein
LTSPDFLADPALRLDAQFARVGVTSQKIEIYGGTSVLETAEAGQPNARQIAQGIAAGGYHGCWVIALGNNDAADVYVGSVLGLSGRVDQMMAVIGSQPVIWLTTKTLRTSGPYANANMEQWNETLERSCAKYPNLRIFDWASVVQSSWYQSDQIHYTSDGYAQRAHSIADSLVHAFPAGQPPSATCMVT